MFQSLNNRLIVAILFAVLLMATLGGFLIRRISDLGEITGEILETNAHVMASINKMEYSGLAYRLAHGTAVRTRARARFLKALTNAEGQVTSSAQRAVLENAKLAWWAYIKEPSPAHFAVLGGDIRTLRKLIHQAAAMRAGRAMRSIRELALFGAFGLAGSLAIMLAFAVWMVRLTIRPMRQLARSVHELNPAGKHRELDRSGIQEFDELAREFNGLVRRLERYERASVDKLLYENAKIDALINSIDDGLILLDRQGKVLHVNFMAGMLLQTDPGELLGRNINDLNVASRFYLNFRNALMSLRHEDQDEPQYSRNEFSLTIRGRLHSYILKTVPFRDKQRHIIGLIVVLQDVTELRHAEQQRAQLFATLSHELKTPLTSLSLSIGMLHETATQERYPEHVCQLLDVGKEEVGQLTALVEDLLDVSRLDATRTRMELKQFELCGFLRRQAHSFRLQAEAQDVSLMVSCIPEMPINADPVKLGWVFSNLLSNALRHTPATGKITLSASFTNKSEVRIEIADTGPGIPEDEIPLIFEWYTQGAKNDKQGSAGMGLAIVREMVEAHGGHIAVESQAGRGTCFIIALPRQLSDTDLPLQPMVPLPSQE